MRIGDQRVYQPEAGVYVWTRLRMWSDKYTVHGLCMHRDTGGVTVQVNMYQYEKIQ